MKSNKIFSNKQKALIERLKGGKVLIAYRLFGAEDKPMKCYIENPYSDEDARTVGSLIDRKILKYEGGQMWILKDEEDD